MSAWVCSRCHTSIQNDDWTWIDDFTSSPADAEREFEHLLTMVDTLGVCRSTVVPDGYFICWVCCEDALGTAYTYNVRSKV